MILLQISLKSDETSGNEKHNPDFFAQLKREKMMM